MSALWLMAVVLTFQWDVPNCVGGMMLVQGTPVPANQPKSDVQLRVVKQGAAMPAGSCSTTYDVPVGSYVFAIWGGQHPTTGVMQETNRCAVVVYPDNPWTTDCPGSGGTRPKTPVNFKVQ